MSNEEKEIVNILRQIEAEELVRVVRCKDCKFAFQHWNNLYRCDNCHRTPYGYGEHQGDWFCADGERKELCE